MLNHAQPYSLTDLPDAARAAVRTALPGLVLRLAAWLSHRSSCSQIRNQRHLITPEHARAPGRDTGRLAYQLIAA